MKKLPYFLIFSLVFGLSATAVAAEVEDYSSTIKVYRDSPVAMKFFDNSYGYGEGACFKSFNCWYHKNALCSVQALSRILGNKS